MLETLRIRNFALIDELEVDFSAGLNALTGETGAGKSILVGALNLVLGARASSEVVRNGAQRAQIEAVFRLPKPSKPLRRLLESHGFELEDDTLLLARSISSDGRSRCSVGGVLTPVSVLAEIGDELVDLHGQHEHQSLFKTDRQLRLLDAYAGLEADADALAEQVSAWRTLARDIETLSQDDRDRVRRLEFLRFEVQEIDAAGLQDGEEEEIKTRLNLINNSENIHKAASAIYEILYDAEEGAAIDGLSTAARELTELARLAPEFAVLEAQLAEARGLVEGVASEVRAYAEGLEFDPAEQEELNRRVALIGSLKRKYGGSIAEILAYRAKADAEASLLENHDARLEELRRQHEALTAQVEACAAELSQKRKASAKKLDKQVASVLKELGMKEGRFETQFEPGPVTARGCDRIEFLLAANVGEPPKPLRQVASGGEISRVMLALKSVFAGADDVPTLIFDEIDAGVGGSVARQVGGKLRALAQERQVLCITHLAQIAVQAGEHLTVRKEQDNGRTVTRVHSVADGARVEELARLLDGSLSEASLAHARTLLAESSS